MKVVVAAGGTGGHLYPALALVEYIKKQDPNSKFLFIGTKDRLESQVVPQLGYDYVGLNVKGLAGNPLKKAHAALLFIKSIGKAKKVIKKFNPDIVVGFGGYPSASALEAAASLKIKTMIHEQNSIIGLTNKILIKKVDKIICCYQKAYEEFPQKNTIAWKSSCKCCQP
ncbi:MAG: UDP-N-acetylglucosamine--N-acetylmuramyl-(pentapeptide) pyrophosphoryl-undecaprenol N-acetylglucosamine transferase [Faecalibacillus intestinalis]|uniref:UDP-N-acetylglucosamine--N-acetylmuramyl- (pentapeptide) pyrophosphoryl-undecaprenol N-acetylglucosamine transferase n=1 Tax=Faecalibacillus intestinalis TaxID=1982626 RepID=UPI00399FEC5E